MIAAVNSPGHMDALLVAMEKLGIETVPAIYLADGEGPYGFMTAMELISKIEQEGEKEDEGKEPKEL